MPCRVTWVPKGFRPGVPRFRAGTQAHRDGVRGLFPEWSGPRGPLQLRFQFPGSGLEVLVSDEVVPGLRVMTAQLSLVPPDEEIELGAVALQDPFLDRLDWDGFVLVVYQPVSGEHCPVELSGLV